MGTKITIIRHVNFTGSTRVGSIVAALAGKYLKPSLMELGGKAPVLLLPDADIKVAASHREWIDHPHQTSSSNYPLLSLT